MIIRWTLLLAALVITIGCEPEPGFGGRASVSGRTFLVDPVLGRTYPIKANVTLLAPENSSSLLTIQTDSLGYFLFSNLTKGEYEVRAFCYKQIDVDNIVKFDSTFRLDLKSNDSKNIDSVKLEINQVGTLILHVVDNEGISQPNFLFCLYSNKEAFDNNDGCKGSFCQSRTGISGVGLVVNLIENSKYYVKACDSLGSIVLSGKDEVVIDSSPKTKSIIVN